MSDGITDYNQRARLKRQKIISEVYEKVDIIVRNAKSYQEIVSQIVRLIVERELNRYTE